ALLDSVVELTGAQRAFVMMVEDGSKLRFKGGRNVDQSSLAKDDFQGSRTVIKQVIQTGEAVAWNSGGEAKARSSMRMQQITSALCVPLVLGARLEGAPRVAGAIYV